MKTKIVTTSDNLQLIQHKDEMLVDSRLIAQHMSIQHEAVARQLQRYEEDFKQFGILRFQIGEIAGRGQPEKYALLNEDQCYLLLSYSRNTKRVRDLKINLVKAFREARQSVDITKREYLPTYHALHDGIHALASQSSNERLVHMNFNKLINRTVGIPSGSRDHLNMAQRSMLVVAQAVAVNATTGATDHRDGYAKVKEALKPLEACKMLPDREVGQ